MRRSRIGALLTIFGSVGAPLGAELGPTGTQFWSQDSEGMGIAMEAGALFGDAIAAAEARTVTRAGLVVADG